MATPTRVLVVGTDAGHVSDLADGLEADGVTVDRADGVNAALSSVAAADCVVTAAELPNSDGVELAEAVAARAADVPVVLAPAEGNERLAAAAVGTAVTEYVPGDTDPEAVVGTVLDRAPGPAAGDGGTVGRAEEISFDLKERALDAAPVGITMTNPALEDNPLVYVNESFEEMTGYDEAEVLGRNCRFLQGDDTEEDAVAEIAEAVDEDRPVTVELKNYTADGDPFWNRLNVAPIRRDGEVTHYVGFQSDVTKRKHAEDAAQRRAEQLNHLVERIDGLLSEATTALVAAESRSAVETAVTALLADTDPYLGAWIATPDYTTDALTPSAAAGVEEAALGAIDTDELSQSDPTAAAAATGEVHSVLVEELPPGPRREAAPEDAVTLSAIPLTYGETDYGVVHLYATESATFDDREVKILGSLGDTVGAGINAVETKRIIASTEIVRLAFDAGDGDLFFVALSARTGARLEHVGSSFTDDAVTMSFTITGTDADSVESFAAAFDGVEGVDIVAETDEDLLAEFTLTEGGVLSLLAEHGAECRSIVVEDGVARIEVEAPQGGNARQLVEVMTDRYPDTSLAAYREAERAEQTRPEFAAMLREQLTDRQYTALQRAHAADFFEWPRPVSGGELAESMDISRPTFHQHLRASLRKLVTAFFDGGSYDRDD
jgi:PAS domain S-box-containing protein